jgi:enoyl-CoA hydratase/carnithine racemase
MTSEVLYSVVDRVATITLNRPEKLNAWTSRMQVQLRKNDPAVR